MVGSWGYRKDKDFFPHPDVIYGLPLTFCSRKGRESSLTSDKVFDLLFLYICVDAYLRVLGIGTPLLFKTITIVTVFMVQL